MKAEVTLNPMIPHMLRLIHNLVESKVPSYSTFVVLSKCPDFSNLGSLCPYTFITFIFTQSGFGAILFNFDLAFCPVDSSCIKIDIGFAISDLENP